MRKTERQVADLRRLGKRVKVRVNRTGWEDGKGEGGEERKEVKKTRRSSQVKDKGNEGQIKKMLQRGL